MGWVQLAHSRTAVKNAGKLLRKSRGEPFKFSEDEVEAALRILENWRAAHAFALNSAQMGLRSRLLTIGVDGYVSQRLKRRQTIIEKLCRQPTMQLSTMQDIAGCRAVVSDIPSVRAVERQWHRTARGKVKETYDYITNPAASGYRGVHLVVMYGDRLVEVQLRSRLQHSWATAVENYGVRLRADLKNGEGPEDALEFFRLVSVAMSLEEAGEAIPDDLREQIFALRDSIEPLLGGAK